MSMKLWFPQQTVFRSHQLFSAIVWVGQWSQISSDHFLGHNSRGQYIFPYVSLTSTRSAAPSTLDQWSEGQGNYRDWLRPILNRFLGSGTLPTRQNETPLGGERWSNVFWVDTQLVCHVVVTRSPYQRLGLMAGIIIIVFFPRHVCLQVLLDWLLAWSSAERASKLSAHCLSHPEWLRVWKEVPEPLDTLMRLAHRHIPSSLLSQKEGMEVIYFVWSRLLWLLQLVVEVGWEAGNLRRLLILWPCSWLTVYLEGACIRSEGA